MAAFARARPCYSGLSATVICCPAWQLVVVAVCRLLNKDYIIIIIIIIITYTHLTVCRSLYLLPVDDVDDDGQYESDH